MTVGLLMEGSAGSRMCHTDEHALILMLNPKHV